MFHKEGYKIILIGTALFTGLSAATLFLIPELLWLKIVLMSVWAFFWIIILQFFRNPARPVPVINDNIVYAPADGKVVVIEETTETEILGQKYIQISVFMSPLNVHVNRHPVSGKMIYYRYHPGKFLMAWNPKASTDNERTTVVYELNNGKKILVRQVAGFLARRIICYAKEGQNADQGGELGFIRFGSRVDVFVPTDAKIQVKIGDITSGNQTVLAILDQQ
jgi:phosphatidylserine decarboxylase